MYSYGDEVQRNFGVRLRGPTCDIYDRGFERQNPQTFGGPLSERLVYLPPDPRAPHGPPRDYYPPGNWVLGPQQVKRSHEGPPGAMARLGLLQGPAWGGSRGIRRAQSFTKGTRPQSMLVESSAPLSLQDNRARSLSASQTSLASGISRLGGKLGGLFSKGNKARQFFSLDRGARRRRLPEPRGPQLPEIPASRLGLGEGGLPYSRLVARRQLPKSPRQQRVLPDLVNHEQRQTPGQRRRAGGRRDFCKEDQWFSKETLYKDHIREVMEKWDNIEDEIWAKVIILERNRRVAKAYARAPILTVNGSEDGFDGFKIGVNGFENPLRDFKVKEFKGQIGAGCKVKMGQTGDILVKRVGRGTIFVKNILGETAVSNEILKLPQGALELDRALKLFDMKKFQENLNRELKRQYPDRSKLESQCMSTLAFVKNEPELLDSPIWMILVNVVAVDMVRVRMAGLRKHAAGSSDDSDPYSPTASSRSSALYLPQHWAGHHSGDCTEDELEPPRRSPRVLARDPYPSYPSPAINPYPSLGANPYPSLGNNPYPSIDRRNPYPSLDRRDPYSSMDRRDPYSSMDRSKEAYSYSSMELEPSLMVGYKGHQGQRTATRRRL